ncbi:hypothetical protein ASPZODRAFT_25354 [Penicilliopsis zonata CBS 506.65]|uniref:Probable E3 ubiquitin ligase complex SCF subunit sconB n=1 Tax=Penicilliopsis zonata CBS 506.65 TaxID=1073090 RepID=A0A1L9SJ92_9EURO|nr:hypothetical protein ASPZODRAFT_25354 [Penicilliopsis zonata CBS 506.65]OJJ47290.1 hypothetical protein ASPZODRAFT_25354 [Penicilliopsis zonata CBS 506.65]
MTQGARRPGFQKVGSDWARAELDRTLLCLGLNVRRVEGDFSIKRSPPVDGTMGESDGEHSIFGPTRTSDENNEFAESTPKPLQKTLNKPFNMTPSKLADANVAPFLAKHIPEQYAPLGPQPGDSVESAMASSRFCYRHRPDLKCRRQADEPTMDKLQHDLESLPQRDRQGIAHVWSLFSAAPPKQRKLMLQGILSQCCFPQLSFISETVDNLVRIDFLAVLPPELSFKILCYLDTASLCKAAQVSRRWKVLADDDVVWHRMCEQHIHRKCKKCGWGLPLLDRKRLRDSKREIELRATNFNMNAAISASSPSHTADTPCSQSEVATINKNKRKSDDIPAEEEAAVKRPCTSIPSAPEEDGDFYTRRRIPWKSVYMKRWKVGNNWRHGRCNVKTFRGHTNGVMCLQFEDNILATGSYDMTIKIWDTDTGKELRTLRGHRAGIRCLQFDDTKLISGSRDGVLKIWNWRTGACIGTHIGHQDGIIGLHFDGGILATASVDTTVKIWNFEGKSTHVLRGHTDWVNAVRIDASSRTVFSASDDCTVRIWDLDTKQCLRIFHGHVGQVQQVALLPREFELDYEEHDAQCENDNHSVLSAAATDSPSPHRTEDDADSVELQTDSFGPFFSSSGDRPEPPRYMITSALDSTVRLWDTMTGKCLRTFFGHVEGVWALSVDNLRVVTGAEDRMVKLWDPRTGLNEGTFTGHLGPVTCVGLGDSRFASGSEDCDVRVYSFEDDEV